MKTIKLFLVAMIATIAMLATSCSKSDDSDNGSVETTKPYKITFESTTSSIPPYPTTIHPKVDFLSDSKVIDSYAPNLSNHSKFNNEITISGNIIGIKVRLTDFDISNPNSGKGSKLDNIKLTIRNNSNNNLINAKYDIPDLQIGPATTLSTYEHTILYNVQTNTFSVSSLTHTF